MSEIHNLIEEREKRAIRSAVSAAHMLTVDAVDLPARPPVTAPGWVVIVRDPEGTEALAYPCETGGDEYANCLLPAPGERHTVVAALREAIAALSPPADEVDPYPAGEGDPIVLRISVDASKARLVIEQTIDSLVRAGSVKPSAEPPSE